MTARDGLLSALGLQSGLQSVRHPHPQQSRPVTPARRDIDQQQSYDREQPPLEPVLWARMRAVVDARSAVADQEIGAAPALRQSLVDLAAVAELMAGELGPLPLDPQPPTAVPVIKQSLVPLTSEAKLTVTTEPSGAS